MENMRNEDFKELNGKIEYEGLGGWLIVIIIRYFISIFSLSKATLKYYEFYSHGIMEQLTNIDSTNYNPSLFAMLNFELIGNIVFLIATVVVLILLFKKKRSFSKYAIALIILNIAFSAIDMLLVNSIGLGESDEMSRLIGYTIGSSILIAYFIKSKRVKNTFTN